MTIQIAESVLVPIRKIAENRILLSAGRKLLMIDQGTLSTIEIEKLEVIDTEKLLTIDVGVQ
jgi:hypothetical protein